MRRSRLIISFVAIGLCMLVLAAMAQACDLSSVGAEGPGGGVARPGDLVTFRVAMIGDAGTGAEWTVSIDNGSGSGSHEIASGVAHGSNPVVTGSFTMSDLGDSPRTVKINAYLANPDNSDGAFKHGTFEYQPAAAPTSQPAAQTPTPQHSSASAGSSSASGSPARTSPSATASQPTRHATARPTHAAVPPSSSSGSGSSAQGQVATSAVATSADATSTQGSLTSSAPAANAAAAHRAAAAHQARAGQSLLQSAHRVQAGAPPLVRKLRVVSSRGVPAGVAIPVGLLLLAAIGAGAYVLLQRRGGSPPLEAAVPITPPAPEPEPAAVTAPPSLEDELDQLVASAASSAPSVVAAKPGHTPSESQAQEQEQTQLLS